MSGYFDCVCCNTTDMGDGPLCDICSALECGEEGDSPECRWCILDGSRGVYLPQAFACNMDMTAWNVSEEDVTALRAGPDGEGYWEAWENVSGYGGAHFVDDKGRRWELEQDGDLFARCVHVPSEVTE